MPYRKPNGHLLKCLRPEAYRQVVELLAEPREHVSYREIARVCRVGGNTVKAIQRAESATITERKAKMLKQVTRVAERAWRTVEDKLDGANLTQATICAGVATEKMLLLAGEPMCRAEINLGSLDIHAEFLRITAEIREAVKQPPLPASQTPFLEAEIVPG